MEMHLASKGPNYVNEFIGMYLVVGFISGLFSIAVALPAHILIYHKAPRHRAKWYAASTSLAASFGVWLFFYGVALKGANFQ